MSADTAAPPPDVIAASRADPGSLQRVPGGEGRSWRAGDVVLKETDNADEVAWIAELLDQVPDGPRFRIARPVASEGGDWVVGGWSATQWLEGDHESGRWDDILEISATFHTALATASRPWPKFLCDRTTPWARGDRVAWGEEEAPSGLTAPVTAALDRLDPLIARRWQGPPPQVIHGDLGGNVLFADAAGLPPAIIDLSLYHRPARFADAVVVADAIAWQGAPATLAEGFANTAPNGTDLLARAVVYRLIAAAHRSIHSPGVVGPEAEADASSTVVGLLAPA